MSERPIGVIDSGLGGLTVLRALIDLLPDEPVVYFGDTGRFPYGPKPDRDVIKYAFEMADVLAERLLAPVRDASVDTLVLGCTHYPLLARTIGDVMGRDVVLVSSADETAFAVRELLTSQNMLIAE